MLISWLINQLNSYFYWQVIFTKKSGERVVEFWKNGESMGIAFELKNIDDNIIVYPFVFLKKRQSIKIIFDKNHLTYLPDNYDCTFDDTNVAIVSNNNDNIN